MASGVTLCSLWGGRGGKWNRTSIAHFDTQECLWGHFFFFIIILALHQQHSVYCDSGFHTFFFWPRLLLVLKFLQDGSTYFRWSEKVFVQLPQTTIMSRHITFYCLQWPHLLPISQSALFCPLHPSVLPPSRGLKTNCQFQTVCVKSTQRNKLKHEL